MKTVKIGFSKSTKKLPILSWLIQRYQGTKYSHIFIEIDHKRLFGVDTIYHSNGDSGVSYYAKPVFLEQNKITDMYELSMPDPTYKSFRSNCHRELGRSYGFLQNIGILIVELLKKIKIKIKNPWRRGFNCSEAVLKALQDLYPDLRHLDPNVIKPIDLEKILKSKNILKIQ